MQSDNDAYFRTMVFTGLVVASATITIASPSVRNWLMRSRIELIDQTDMDGICETILCMPESEISLQWSRDRDRISFIGTTAQYVYEHMQWAVPFVTQTVPNSVWCVLNAKNAHDIVFTSPQSGLSVHRIGDAHVRCHLKFTVMRLDDHGMVREGDEAGNAVVAVTYDVVDTRYDDGDDVAGDPHILLIGCSK